MKKLRVGITLLAVAVVLLLAVGPLAVLVGWAAVAALAGPLLGAGTIVSLDALAVAAAVIIHLTDREREMLRILAESPGETVPRGALTGNGSVNERAVDVQINRLRRKIERDPANPLFLQAVRGIGYRLVASP